MNFSNYKGRYVINIEDMNAIIETGESEKLIVRRLPDGGLEIAYNEMSLLLKGGKVTSLKVKADGRTLPIDVLPGYQQFKAPQPVDFNPNWAARVNADLSGLREDINRIDKRLSDAGVQSLRPTDGVKKVASEKQPAISFEDMIHFMTTGAVRIKLSMSGEEIETFLTGHAVNWKNVNAGIEIIATPQRIFQIACHWTTYRREREALKDPNKLSKAVLTLCEAFETDKGFYDSWKANIAVAFSDEFRNMPISETDICNKYMADGWLHIVSNRAAEKFLRILLPPKKGEGEPFAGANVSSMAAQTPNPDGKVPGGAGDTSTGQWLYHGTKYWITPAGNDCKSEIHALYNGHGTFLYNGREVRMEENTKAKTR